MDCGIVAKYREMPSRDISLQIGLAAAQIAKAQIPRGLPMRFLASTHGAGSNANGMGLSRPRTFPGILNLAASAAAWSPMGIVYRNVSNRRQVTFVVKILIFGQTCATPVGQYPTDRARPLFFAD